MPERDVTINLIANDRTGQATRSAARNLEQLARKAERVKTTKIAGIDNRKGVVHEGRLVRQAEAAAAKAGNRAGTVFVSRFRDRLRGRFNPDFGRVIDASRRAGTLAGKGFHTAFERRAFRAVKGFGRGAGGFGAGFLKIASFGVLGNDIASGLIKKSPVFSKVGGTIGAIFAAKFITTAASAITAGLPLLLGGGILAGPIAFLLKGQSKASKELEKNGKKQESLRKRLLSAQRAPAGETKNGKANRMARIKDLQKELGILEKEQDKLEKLSAGWQQLKDKAKSFMQFISAPVQVPLQKAIDAIGKGLDQIKGPVREFTSALGPALVPFTKGVMKGIEQFFVSLRPALPGIVAGFKEWGKQIAILGSNLGTAFAHILSDPEKVVAAIRRVFGVIQTVIAIVTALVSILTSADGLWKKFGSGFNVGTMVGKIAAVKIAFYQLAAAAAAGARQALVAFALLVNGIIGGFITIANAWNRLPNWITGGDVDISGIQAFQQQFNTTVASMVNKLGEFEAAAKAAEQGVRFDADEAPLKQKLADAKKRLADLKKQKPTPKVRADIKQAQRMIDVLTAELARLDRYRAYPKVIITYSTRGPHGGTTGARPTGPAGGKGGGSGGIPRDASPSWGDALGGGAAARSMSAGPVNVEAPIVDVRAFLDGDVIDARVQKTVIDSERRATHRTRVGRRR